MSDYLFRQQVQDRNGNFYYVVARTDDEHVLHVSPVDGKYGGLSFCIEHQIAYRNHEACDACRLQVVPEPIG